LRMQVDELEKSTGKKNFLIAESDMNDVKILDAFEQGGYGLDGQWADDFHHAVHTLGTGEKMSYYGDYGEISQMAKSYKQAFIYDGIYSDFRKKTVGTKPGDTPAHKFVVCIQNHDQVGNRMLGDRLTRLVSFEMLKLSAGFLLSSRFVPMLFMGEEYGEDQPFQYFVDHGEPDLVEAVREGRKKEFESFQWEGEVPDPQSEKTYANSKLLWNFTEDVQKRIIFNYYQRLIKLRKEGYFASFRDTDFKVQHQEQEKTISVYTAEGKRRIFA